MNRKISTLFTAGLLMASALCSSAWAQSSIEDLVGLSGATPVTELKDGGQYVLVNDVTNKGAYGQELDGSTIKEFVKALDDPFAADKNDDVKKYVWTVSMTESPKGFFTYNFKNVETGKLLRLKGNFSGIETNGNEKDENTNKDFVFGSAANSFGGAKYSSSNSFLHVYESASASKGFSWDVTSTPVSTVTDPAGASAPVFYEVKSETLTKGDELNDLYNTSGFSFITKRLKDQTEEPIGNLFNGKTVVARYISDITVDATGTKYAQGDLKIPGGMYFFTENTPKEGDRNYKTWLDATVLVVSSTETMEGTNAGRANGDGFVLTEMKISDLNLYTGAKDDWKTQGDETSIYNACFDVQKSYVEAYPYELNLKSFRYRVQGSKADHKTAPVKLSVLQHNDNFYLATTSATPVQFIFKLGFAGTKKGIELLNTEAKAAAYTIRILDGEKGNVKSAYGKYLTSAYASGSNFDFVAKAKVLSQLEAPAYQWIITSVDNTYSIVFTNRETGQQFTTSLFPKTALGENVYETSGQSYDITPIYVDENTYRETASRGYEVDLGRVLVELIPVDVDTYAGFLNVDDRTLVTMAFARDNNETSNKWYAAVKNDKLNANGKFSNDVSGAAQWQLVKERNPRTIIESSFVYNRGNHVTVQAKGDKGYAYAYRLQYINDGKETANYLQAGTGLTGTVSANENLVPVSTAGAFVIKQSVDGSVYLIKVDDTNANVTTAFKNNMKSVVEVKYNSSSEDYEYTTPSYVYAWPATVDQDLKLKTYLIEEAPEISYPAKEGHISLISELGNYISMNEEREGIVVNNEQYSFYLRVTDTKAIVPSFYISKGTEDANRSLFLFNPQDSVQYYVADGKYDRKYEWAEGATKAIFKAASIEANKDTLSTIVKGNEVKVADKADDEGVLGGIANFKVQILQSEDAEDMYVIRSVRDSKYLYGINDKLAWGSKDNAMKFTITAGDPTSTESVADGAAGVKVIGGDGSVEIQGAAGKTVVITNILGKVVANTVLTSDNVKIAVPAGIVAVAVNGEEAVKTIVK